MNNFTSSPDNPSRNKFTIGKLVIFFAIVLVVKMCVSNVCGPHKNFYYPSTDIGATAASNSSLTQIMKEDLGLSECVAILKYARLDSAILDSSELYKLRGHIISNAEGETNMLDTFYHAYQLFATWYLKSDLECAIKYSKGRNETTCDWSDSTEKYYLMIYDQFNCKEIKQFKKQYDLDVQFSRAHPEVVELKGEEAERVVSLYIVKQNMAFSRNYKFLFNKKYKLIFFP